MIPLLIIFKFFAFCLSVFASLKLRSSWKRNQPNEALFCFYRFFLFTSLVFLFFSLIPFISFNLHLVQIFFYAVNIFTFISTAYLAKIVLIFTYFKRLKDVVFKLTIFLTLIEFLVGIIYFKPASVFIYQYGGFNFILWGLNFPCWLMILHGLVMMLVGALSVILFFKKGFSQKDSYLKIRYSFLGTGILFLLFAALSFYIFGAVISASLLKDFFHGTSSFLGLVFILTGIYYKKYLL